MRTGTDECNLGAVNLDGQAGLDAGAELPDEGKPAASQRSTCCFQGYGMLARLDVGADACLFHLVIDDNLVGIAIQRHALSKLIFGCNDNLFATRELNRALGCTTVRVELAYGKLSKRNGRLSSRNNGNVVPIGRTEGKGCPIVAP